MDATEWNRTYPIGTPVRVTLDTGEPLMTHTASHAIQGSEIDRIAVLGVYKGYVRLDDVEPLARAAAPVSPAAAGGLPTAPR